MRFYRLVLLSLAGTGLLVNSFAANAVVNTGVNPVAMGSIPAVLHAMESPAEDMLDAAIAAERVGLKQHFATLTLAMVGLNHLNEAAVTSLQTRNIGLQNSWFELISIEMKEMDDMPALAYAVNQFSGQLIVTASFSHEYEKDIAWMDYLGREVLLLSKYPGLNQAMLNVRQQDLQNTWRTLSAELVLHPGGAAVADRVTPVIQHLRVATQPELRVTLANQELELVDNIEAFFNIE